MQKLLTAIAALVPLLAAAQEGYAEDPSTVPVWVEQKAANGVLRFSVLTAPDGWENVAPRALRIYDRRTGDLIQEFSDIDSITPHTAADELVRVVDANFDGHPDIQLRMDSGGAGPNDTSNYYLYDPATRRFALDPQLSALTQVSINRDRTISSFSRDGCCAHGQERYRYIGERLTLVFSESRRWMAPGKVEVSTGKLVHGKMKYVTRTVKE